MAQITGITQNARDAIVSALQQYEKYLRNDVSAYSTAVRQIVQGEHAQAALNKLGSKIINDYREEVANQIDIIEKIAGTLDSNYAKIDSQTTFQKS